MSVRLPRAEQLNDPRSRGGVQALCGEIRGGESRAHRRAPALEGYIEAVERGHGDRDRPGRLDSREEAPTAECLCAVVVALCVYVYSGARGHVEAVEEQCGAPSAVVGVHPPLARLERVHVLRRRAAVGEYMCGPIQHRGIHGEAAVVIGPVGIEGELEPASTTATTAAVRG